MTPVNSTAECQTLTYTALNNNIVLPSLHLMPYNTHHLKIGDRNFQLNRNFLKLFNSKVLNSFHFIRSSSPVSRVHCLPLCGVILSANLKIIEHFVAEKPSRLSWRTCTARKSSVDDSWSVLASWLGSFSSYSQIWSADCMNDFPSYPAFHVKWVVIMTVLWTVMPSSPQSNQLNGTTLKTPKQDKEIR